MDAKTDLEVQDQEGLTALLLACKFGQAPIAEFLISQGARCDTSDKDGYTPLMEASQAGIIDLVKVLSNRQVELEAKCRSTGDTPLHIAISNAHLDTAEYLASRGMNCSLSNNAGNTPLHLAVKRGYLDLVELLSSNASVDLSARNGANESPLMLAITEGHYHVAKYLIEHGAHLFLDHEEFSQIINLGFPEDAEEIITMVIESSEQCIELVG